MNIVTKTKIIIPILSLALCVPLLALAAELRLDPHKVAVGLREQFIVDVVVNSADSLNAVQGQLVFSAEQLTPVNILDGNTVINFWVEKPNSPEPGIIAFSGITPGGFSGPTNLLFSVVFEAKNTGPANIAFQEIKVLLNDGQGTEAAFSTRNTTILVKPGDSNVRRETFSDTEPPEDFTPLIARDPNIFDGKYFLVFSTQDKKSGINRYEVREGKWSWFHEAESPYLLRDQNLRSKIYIKAIDQNDNERLVIVASRNLAPWWQDSNWIVIILGALLAGILAKKLWPNSTK